MLSYVRIKRCCNSCHDNDRQRLIQYCERDEINEGERYMYVHVNDKGNPNVKESNLLCMEMGNRQTNTKRGYVHGHDRRT